MSAFICTTNKQSILGTGMRILTYLFAYVLIFISGFPASAQGIDCSKVHSIHKNGDAQTERVATNPYKISVKQTESDPHSDDLLYPALITAYLVFHAVRPCSPRKITCSSTPEAEHLCPRAPPVV
jgi:hypothetical protein